MYVLRDLDILWQKSMPLHLPARFGGGKTPPHWPHNDPHRFSDGPDGAPWAGWIIFTRGPACGLLCKHNSISDYIKQIPSNSVRKKGSELVEYGTSTRTSSMASAQQRLSSVMGHLKPLPTTKSQILEKNPDDIVSMMRSGLVALELMSFRLSHMRQGHLSQKHERVL